MQGFFEYLFESVLLVEAIDSSTGVYQLLLAGIEGVTLGADFDANVLLSRTSLKHRTAGTTNCGLLIFRVDTFLHHVHLFRSISKKGNALTSKIADVL